MTKVITYGTYDLLHHGHIRLLERAKALGDYLIVGITADTFDQARGKINVQQSLIERIEAVRATGIADEIIVEEYEGQKIDDIKRYGVDIFTVGSDWKGKFDYLQEYCKVVYLERTTGVSSTEIRAGKDELRIGIVGESRIINKFEKESHFVNGVIISGIYSEDYSSLTNELKKMAGETATYQELLDKSDAVYIISQPTLHYQQAKEALLKGKHVLCESPIALQESQLAELSEIAREKGLVLSDGIKTAYSTAYNRMLLLVKSGVIGTPVSVDAVCTSLSDLESSDPRQLTHKWNSICAWGPTALLPILQILGTGYSSFQMTSQLLKEDFDAFTKVSFVYPHAVASIKVGVGVKSEGEMTVSGTKGYIYIPAPWWKTDYFEVRYENPADNRRYYYQLDGEGIRYEIVSFLKAIQTGKDFSYIETRHSEAIVRIIEAFYQHRFIEL
jgi:choline-phosphate cytidylyltransferase